MPHFNDFFSRLFSSPAAKNPVDAADYVHISRQCMAANFEVFLNAGEYVNGVKIALEALDEVTRLEETLSFFADESEIARLNRMAERDFVEIEPEVYHLLRKCDKIYQASGGAFDITATPLWEVWGFARRKAVFPDEQARLDALAKVGGDALRWDDARCAVKYEKPGVKVSLGSVGKGFALDAAIRVLEAAELRNYLFHGGGSSVYASGFRRGRADWLVGLHHPLKAGVRLMEIPLRDRALATSGSATQFFWWRGKRYGHILDPRTGFPVENMLSATVLAGNATDADMLATAMYVMGVEWAEAFCAERPELGAIFVLPGEGGKLEIRKIGNTDGTER